MEFSELIQKRLTTLRYRDKKVSEENIEKIIDSAMVAPSAKNRQPWRFYILSDEEKRVIAEKMENWINNTGLVTTIKRTAGLMKEAGNCILVYSNRWDRNQVDRIKEPKKLLNGEDIEDMVVMHEYYFDRIKVDVLSIGAAVEHMLLKATELGIDTTWLGDVLFIDDEINQYLGLEHMELICGIVFGYRREEPRRKGRYPREYLMLKGEEDGEKKS